MESKDSKAGISHEVFIRKDAHRLFAVLKVDGKEYVERLGLQIQKFPEEQQKRVLERVADRLMKRAGIRKVRTLNTLDKLPVP